MKLAATFARSLQADMQAELLTNSWGDRHYPNQWLDAASLICSKAHRSCGEARAVFRGSSEPSHRGGVHGVRSASRRLRSTTIPRHRGWPELACGSTIGRVPVPLARRLVRRGSERRRTDQHARESGDC